MIRHRTPTYLTLALLIVAAGLLAWQLIVVWA